VGFDSQSKGHRVYWPERRRVSVECNVRFAEEGQPAAWEDDTLELEGEEVSGNGQMLGNGKPESVTDNDSNSGPELEEPAAEPSTPPAPPKPSLPEPPPAPRPSRVHKPSQKVSNILASKGVDKDILCGVPVPTQDIPKAAELSEEISGVAMAAHIADAEGLDPWSIEEVQRRPEWPR
ncbi:hypothetical protein DAEQUDRAFT_645664, partial [Daedalea quercina L-15889]